ncbi:outer membrane beta-barrel protein [Brevundimonas sp. PAMC22021]|uniref:outer membrane beta-barrel protein n=1 Tax=Brevundimonas sp. PAMC22021 TaxID=2861285 RepID=UPI0021076913|nr:outer membrane beta-barrel protein [Brevundimonas sp. PAMC22021]
MVLLAASTWASDAMAQVSAQPAPLFERDRGMAVRDRPHPEYEATGARLGGFVLRPRAEVGTEIVDNLYAAPADRVADSLLRLAAGASLRSTWSRHALVVQADGVARRHASASREDSSDGSLDLSGRLDLTRDMDLAFGAGLSRRAEPRGAVDAPDVSAEPIVIEARELHLQGRRVSGRFRTTLRAEQRRLDFRDGETAAGEEVDQDHRDRTVSRLTGRADYAVTPAVALFVQGSADRRDYDSARGRDSAGGEALLGADFEVGALIRAQIAAGHVRQAFDDPAIRDIQGVAATARVEWFPTQLTTVTLTGDRTVEDAERLGSAASLSSRVALAVDHELLRNLILSARIGWRRQAYNDVDREDRRFTTALEASYLFNRRYGVRLTGIHEQRSSRGRSAGAGFEINRLAGALVARF